MCSNIMFLRKSLSWCNLVSYQACDYKQDMYQTSLQIIISFNSSFNIDKELCDGPDQLSKERIIKYIMD